MTTVENRVIAGLERAMNTRIVSIGSAAIAMLPIPHISLRDVQLAAADGSVSASVARARADIKLLPLITGRLDYDGLTLIAPQIVVQVGSTADGIESWLPSATGLLTNAESHGRITIVGGSVLAQSPGGLMQPLTTNVDMVVARRRDKGPIEARGAFVWRGETTQAQLRWPVAQGVAPASVNVSSPPLTLNFDGMRTVGPEASLKGKLTVETTSAPGALAWIGASTPLAETLGPLKISGTADIAAGRGTLTKVVALLGTDNLEGDLTLDLTGANWSLGGTLAGASLDLSTKFRRIDTGTVKLNESQVTTKASIEALTRHNIDLRLSIDTVRHNELSLTDVAAQILVKPGRLDFGLSQANAYGGTTKGRFVLSQSAAGMDVRLQAGMDKVDLGKLSASQPGVRRFSGIGYGQLVVEASGATVDEVAAGLAGRLSLTARNGEVAGVGLGDLVRRMERQPATALRDWRNGRGVFDQVAVAGTITAGVLELGDSMISGPGYRLTLGGRTFLASQRLALTGLLVGGTSGAVRLPIEITGPLAAPLITPDLHH